MTTIEIDVGSVADPGTTEQIEFLVDSGATHSVVPANVLARLGIQPLTEEVFTLANGDRISRKMGAAVFRLGERIGGADVVFGEAGDSKLLGILTLAALGLSLDSLKHELNELPMLL